MATQTGIRPATPLPTLVSAQVTHLAGRGMEIPDRDAAERCLNHIGFYRLRAYWSALESVDVTDTDSGRRFRPGTSFNGVMARYMFDQRLRALLLEAFSYIEISVKSQWAYHLTNVFGYGTFAHQNGKLFKAKYHSGNLNELQRSYNQMTRNMAADFNDLTVWDLMPSMSFGQLSKWYANLSDRMIRQAIARVYGMDEAILAPALHQISKVRNICAHHERLWDRRISSGFRIPKNLGGAMTDPIVFNIKEPGKIYNTLVMTAYLMETITPNGDWTKRFLDFRTANSHRDISDDEMGFPPNWRDLAPWRQTNL